MEREEELKKESTLNKILEMLRKSTRDIQEDTVPRLLLKYEPNKRG
jgi:hypothetical protein